MTSTPTPLEEAGGVAADLRDIHLHPTALCESGDVGPGTRIGAFAHIRPSATIGHDCAIGSHVCLNDAVRLGDGVTVHDAAVLCSGVTVEDHAVIGPGVVFADRGVPRRDNDGRPEQEPSTITVRRGAVVGAGAVIVSGSVIGDYALVGPGTVIERNVPDHAVIVGSSAHRIGWICRCGHRLADSLICPSCRRNYRLTRSGLRELPR